VAHSIRGGVQWLGRINIMGRQGRDVAVDLHAIPVRSQDGAIHGATVLLHDVTSETSLEEKCQALHAQVAKDPMTQVANRAEFDRMLNNFVAAHQESHLPCSLVMADIDHFKSINDTLGHGAGDSALKEFTGRLARVVRQSDQIGRYGGEEFLIIAAGPLTRETLGKAAERLRQAIIASAFDLGGEARPITASFGAAIASGVNETAQDVIDAADRALYAAKHGGRNRVVMAAEADKKPADPHSQAG
jgi:diguanylate cyclase (GGDEF)-like protein